MKPTSSTLKNRMIGVLDIYGFESFLKNSFEQFVINYCNEKLQQLSISLTLKAEQDDYILEGVDWGHIEYFNNKCICDMIDMKNTGILSLLNEETIRPGDPTDSTFLQKMDSQLVNNDYYDSYEKNKGDKKLNGLVFRIKHYAGDVDYDINGFLFKNRDDLYSDVFFCLNQSSRPMIRDLFPEKSSMEGSLKRPDTLGTKFKSSMNQLMADLKSKNAHYIRCISPNREKKPFVFDSEYVLHQWKFMGLLENIHVRRAGYCFRQNFDTFYKSFRMLSSLIGNPPKEQILAIMNGQGIDSTEYKLGKTMVFIKKSSTVLVFLE